MKLAQIKLPINLFRPFSKAREHFHILFDLIAAGKILPKGMGIGNGRGRDYREYETK